MTVKKQYAQLFIFFFFSFCPFPGSMARTHEIHDTPSCSRKVTPAFNLGCEPIVSTSEEASASTSMDGTRKHGQPIIHVRRPSHEETRLFLDHARGGAVPNGSWCRGSSTAYLTMRDDRYISASDRFDRLANTYITDVTKGGRPAGTWIRCFRIPTWDSSTMAIRPAVCRTSIM